MKTGSTKGREDKGLSGYLYFGCVLGLLVMCCGMSVGFSVYNKYLFSGPIPVKESRMSTIVTFSDLVVPLFRHRF